MVPRLADVYAARRIIYETLRPTALLPHALLRAETGLDIYVKHENHNPTNSFKVRGGLNLVRQLTADERRGVMTASTGNHGQSIAFASRREGVPCIVAVPEGNNPEKNASMRALGATVVEIGADFDAAREYVEAEHVARGLRYIHSANEPLLIAGVATLAVEIFEELPDADTILVPVGGGSGASGVGLVRSALGSRAQVIGVQAAGADAFTRSWRSGRRVSARSVETLAEGMATRTTYDLTFDILSRELDDVVTLSEEEIVDGMRLALRATHNLAEGAGAASLAAAVKLRRSLAGRKVVCVMSGGNLDSGLLHPLLQTRPAGS